MSVVLPPATQQAFVAETSAADETLLTIRNVSKRFETSRHDTTSLHDISLEIKKGEFICVVGPSGCGKSTLLNLIAGLESVDEGEITTARVNVHGRTADELSRLRRRHVGIVFQFFNLLDDMTVTENVVLPAVIAGSKRRAAETRARDLLDLLGLGSKANEMPAALSGGQRQRLAIARALANEPTLLLADEPTGALDSRTGDEILALFARLRGAGHTLVLITHDANIAAHAERVLHMADGALLESLTPPGPTP